MSELVFLLEEPSAMVMLQGLLPKIAPHTPIRYIVFKGKQDLDKQLIHRLRHYQVSDARFVVLRDQDAADCQAIKSRLLEKAQTAGKSRTLVRIACHELESWYLADLAAVELALGVNGLASQQNKRKYRAPDDLANASEELSKLTGRRYQKIGGSRAIGPHLDTANIRSRSFAAFVTGVRNLIAES